MMTGLAAPWPQALGSVGVEGDLAHRGPGETLSPWPAAPGALRRLPAGVELGVQEEVDLSGLTRSTASSRVISFSSPCRRRCAPRPAPCACRARLQHPQLAALDGELHVLHLAVVLLEPADAANSRRRGHLLASCAIGLVMRMPATTSSPWALVR
jgi:hypothetical protein